jgi:hypothetical protein
LTAEGVSQYCGGSVGANGMVRGALLESVVATLLRSCVCVERRKMPRCGFGGRLDCEQERSARWWEGRGSEKQSKSNGSRNKAKRGEPWTPRERPWCLAHPPPPPPIKALQDLAVTSGYSLLIKKCKWSDWRVHKCKSVTFVHSLSNCTSEGGLGVTVPSEPSPW